MSSISIDVVIPCYNGVAYLKRCVNSVLDQTYKACRIILVDDGSTDDSLSTMWKLQRRHAEIDIICQSNMGLSSARNAGIRNSNSDLVAFLDVDDYWLPTKLENQLALLEKFNDRNSVAIASNYLSLKRGILTPGIRNLRSQEFSPKSLLTFRAVIPGSGSSVLLSRSIIEYCGYFDETLNYGEDLDYWVRVSKKFRWAIALENDVVIYSNTEGIQARARKDLQLLLDGSRKLLLKHSTELNSVDLIFMNSYFESLVQRLAKKQLLNGDIQNSKPKLHTYLMGSAYAFHLKLSRKYSTYKFR